MSITTEIPDLLRGIAPPIGSTWMWEPLKPHAAERCRVTNVRWNGEEVWVEAVGKDGQPTWNELSRWVEAAVLLEPAPDDPGACQRLIVDMSTKPCDWWPAACECSKQLDDLRSEVERLQRRLEWHEAMAREIDRLETMIAQMRSDTRNGWV